MRNLKCGGGVMKQNQKYRGLYLKSMNENAIRKWRNETPAKPMWQSANGVNVGEKPLSAANEEKAYNGYQPNRINELTAQYHK